MKRRLMLSLNMNVVTLCLALLLTPFQDASTATWTGAGADNLATTPENWSDNVAPTEGAPIILDASTGKAMTWDLDVPVASWTQDGYTGTVTIATRYGSTGFNNLVITGDCLLLSGKWVHTVNPSTATYRLRATIGGDLTVGTNATISADDRGYPKGRTPFGATTPGQTGGTYGGPAASAQVPYPALAHRIYGSVTAPTDLGAGAHYNETKGGGAIWIDVAGAVLHNGSISANSLPWSNYSGSGGSIFITSGSLRGTGIIKANSGDSKNSGSGGRIALVLTAVGVDFADFDLRNVTAISERAHATDGGSAGTIYLETAADRKDHGELVIRGNGVLPRDSIRYHRIIPDGESIADYARITLTNGVMVRLPADDTLILTNTVITADYHASLLNGIYLDGGALAVEEDSELVINDLLVQSVKPLNFVADSLCITNRGRLHILDVPQTFSGPVAVQNGGTLQIDAPFTVDGDLNLDAGAIITCDGPAEIPSVQLDLTVLGDVTLAAGAAIDATGLGYTKNYGPGKGSTTKGASHGGQGTTGTLTAPFSYPPYGSIHSPDTWGSGGASGAGGGVILLNIAGLLANDGLITTAGGDGSAKSSSGAGGSVSITTARISGSGVINADGGAMLLATSVPSGGGRVAVTLTDADSAFSDYAGQISAYGSWYGGASDTSGGAGTVYLRAPGETEEAGTLIIDNNNGATPSVTPLNDTTDGDRFGNVIVQNGSRLVLEADKQIFVSGSWTNGASVETAAGSLVTFESDTPSLITGNTTFAGLECLVANKRLIFAADSEQTVSGVLNLQGLADEPLLLESSAPSTAWQLTVAEDAGILAENVSVSDSDASAGTKITAVNSVDGGGNTNWKFISIAPGETVVWTGAADESWGNPDNWDLARIPISSDHVTVPATAVKPVLGRSVTVASLSLSQGTTLSLAGMDLTVDGDLSVAGQLIAAFSETIACLGNVTFTGSFVPSTSTLRICGTGAQTLSLGNAVFSTIAIENDSAAVTISGSPYTSRLACGDGNSNFELVFAPASKLTVSVLQLNGNAGVPNIRLRSSVSGQAWELNAGSSSVTGVDVSDCNAASGTSIVPIDSTDSGGNINWFFTDTRARWTGASDSDFHADANWEGGVVPAPDASVVFDSANPAIISQSVTLGHLTVANGALLTVDAAATITGSVVVETGGTLRWNQPGSIGGNLVLLDGANLTHSANSTTAVGEVNKLDLTITGNGLILPSATIDVTQKGYRYQQGPGYVFNKGSSHGGRGGSTTAAPCYGSILYPTNIGTGGSGHISNAGRYGGGAVKLSFGGHFEIYGPILADGGSGIPGAETHYMGAGGSIFVTAAKMTGTGEIRAQGGSATSVSSGGGRIALKLTGPGADFSTFSGSVTAFGGLDVLDTPTSACGTIYQETAVDGPGRGTVLLANKNASAKSTSNMTDLPSVSRSNPRETERTIVRVTSGSVLNITADTTIKDLFLEGANCRILLNGFTLTVRSNQHSLGTAGAQVVTGTGGQILWEPHFPGTVIIVQ